MLLFFLAVIIRSNWRCMHLITTRYEVLWESYPRYHAVSDIQYVSHPQGYTLIALWLNDVPVPVVDWCFFCTDWLILLSKHWMTDNVICSLRANRRPADTESNACIMMGDDGDDGFRRREGNRLSILRMRSEWPHIQTQTQTRWRTTITRNEEQGTFTSRCWRCWNGRAVYHSLRVWVECHLYAALDICDTAPVLMTPCHLHGKVLNMGW